MNERASHLELLVDGLVFPEAPRWYDDSLWVSDIHAHSVVRFDEAGALIARHPFGDRVSGLGHLPNDDALVVSMLDRCLLRFGSHGPTVHADLSPYCQGFLNDMVVDARGFAYVGARNPGGGDQGPLDAVILATPEGEVRVAADAMQSPNGSVVTPDGSTLIVAETSQARLLAFTIDDDGSLHDRRVFAEVPGRHPDGICLDAEGAIWFGSPMNAEFVRVHEGGRVSQTVATTPDRWAVACALGGHDGHTLFAVTGHNSVANIMAMGSDRNLDVTSKASGEVWVTRVDVPGWG
ncbi:MAG: SMP-30/gluconolactonase/LRE family protein [Acidimicrobiales bacterium]